jgi:hypothetical protein
MEKYERKILDPGRAQKLAHGLVPGPQAPKFVHTDFFINFHSHASYSPTNYPISIAFIHLSFYHSHLKGGKRKTLFYSYREKGKLLS